MTAEVVNGYYDRLVSGQWEQSLLAITRDMSKNTISFRLEDITSPTLILWGQNDTWAKQADIDRWRHEIPSVGSHAIPKAGHMLMEENPELFDNMLLTFLQCHG